MVAPNEKTKTDFLESVLRIYSPSGSEGELSRYLRDRLVEFGYDQVTVDRVGNVVGEMGGGQTVVFYCGHMDTVRGHLDVKLSEGRLYGRGAVDAKSSLAAMLMAPLTLEGRLPCKVVVAASVGEEAEGEGIKELLSSRIVGGCNVFGEPSGLRSITVGYRGKLDLTLEIRTKSGHSGAAWRFENPIESCYALLGLIRSEFESKAGVPAGYHSVTLSPNLVRGGGARNITPSSCRMCVDVRLPPGVSTEAAIELIETVKADYLEGHPLELDILFSDDRVEPYETDRSSPGLRALMRSILTVAGGPVRLTRKTGTGDMNLFASRTGAHAVSYGPGDPSLSHTDEEYVDINEYLCTISVLSETIRQFTYLSSRKYHL